MNFKFNAIRWIIFALILIALISALIIILYYSNSETFGKKCTDLHNYTNFKYGVCYDAYSKFIYLEIKRDLDKYEINEIEAVYFDFSQKSYTIKELPKQGVSKYYKMPADRNPLSMDIYLKSANLYYCEIPKTILIEYCPSNFSSEQINANINLISNATISNFVPIQSPDSDTISQNLIDAAKTWDTSCNSKWTCSGWEQCIDGIRKRTCTDEHSCIIPTNAPEETQNCDGCTEDWNCDWPDCVEGYTTPDCTDIHNCGTDYNKPTQIKCNKKCKPEITCSNWDECIADYDFLTLANGIYFYNGTQSRLCKDKNNCAEPKLEYRQCSLSVDVYTSLFKKCGKTYLGIYNKLTNQIIATVEKGTENNPYMNIDLSGSTTPYCDYCYNGKLDGDETDIDCGGSCESCLTKTVQQDYQKGFFSKIIDAIKEFLS